VKQSEDVDEPYNEHDYDNAVQDSFDLTLHGNEAIDQPKQHADYADRENNRDKWHFMYSNRFLEAEICFMLILPKQYGNC